MDKVVRTTEFCRNRLCCIFRETPGVKSIRLYLLFTLLGGMWQHNKRHPMGAKSLLPVVVVPRFNQKTELNRKTDTSETDTRWGLQDRSADKHSPRPIKWENQMESRQKPKRQYYPLDRQRAARLQLAPGAASSWCIDSQKASELELI